VNQSQNKTEHPVTRGMSMVVAFQILGTNSDESFSWGGTLNTSSKLKTAYVNVKQRCAIK